MENLVARTPGPSGPETEEGGPKGQNRHALRELGSYILRDTPEP